MAVAEIVLVQIWVMLGIGITIAAVVIFISGLDDAFLDITHLILRLARRDPAPSEEMIGRKPERWAAILLPAWDESAVIAAMLRRYCGTIDYSNYRVFVAVYPNDPATEQQVRSAMGNFRQVQPVILERPGPTSKADALNQLKDAALAHAEQTGKPFAFFVLHDAEDVVHPFSLRLMNWYTEFAPLVQLPVFSINRPLNRIVAGIYMDEFAELHCKDLWVRSRVNKQVPSAGVATAFTIEAIDALAEQGAVFDAASLTEDYEISHRLNMLGLRSMFVRFRMKSGEIVSTRELFPDQYSLSVRQKTRWVYGIVFAAWRSLGWYGSLWNRYFLFRDRKIIIAAVAVMVAYLLVALLLITYVSAVLLGLFDTLPPLIEAAWVWAVLSANLCLLASRLAQRAFFTGRTHGVSAALLSPVRAVVGNFVSYHSLFRAFKRHLGVQLRQRAVSWDKTDHQFPSAALLMRQRPLLTDILHHNGLLSADAVKRVRAYAHSFHRPLGLALQDLELCTGAQIAEALAERNRLPMRRLDAALNDTLFARLSREDCARYAVICVEASDRPVILMGEELSCADRRRLNRLVRRAGIADALFAYAPLSEIAYAIRFAGSREDAALERAISIWVGHDDSDGELSRDIRRRLRADYRRFRDLLVERGLIDHHRIRKIWLKSKRRKVDVEALLGVERSIPPLSLRQASQDFSNWAPAIEATMPRLVTSERLGETMPQRPLPVG
ncbi:MULTISPECIES: glycosyltransferase [unclassified Sphingomonas]|uniref:glycosyltransferase n=1 Tax=unclassified Sphingomonas TaxID=196159 RepID=UPI00269E37C4